MCLLFIVSVCVLFCVVDVVVSWNVLFEKNIPFTCGVCGTSPMFFDQGLHFPERYPNIQLFLLWTRKIVYKMFLSEVDKNFQVQLTLYPVHPPVFSRIERYLDF